MKIRVENARAKVVNASRDELWWLHSYLSFEDKTKQFAMRGRWGRGKPEDTKIHLLDRRNNTFPSGLVSMIQPAIDGLRADGQDGDLTDVEIEDARIKTAEWDPGADLEWLRDYQFAAVETAVERTRGILQLPTGAGKTEIIFGVVKALPCHWLFAVHRSGLMRQTAERALARGMNAPGIVGDGEFSPDPERRFTVSTLQTLARGIRKKDPKTLQLLHDVEGVIIDECHIAAATTFMEVIMECRRAYFRLGVSGTPLARGDRRSTLAVACLGPIIYEIKESELVKRGLLAKTTIYGVPFVQNCPADDWQSAYREVVVRSQTRNDLIVELAKLAEKPTFVFVQNVQHGKHLAQRLRMSGIKADFVWGAKSTKERERAVKLLERGDIDAIVCSVVFQEGLDVPSLRSVINAAGGKTVIGALQRIGRGMRVTADKTTLSVYDVLDKGCRFTEAHAKERFRAYKKKEHTICRTTLPDLQAMRRA